MTPSNNSLPGTTQPSAVAWLCALVAAWLLPGLVGHDPWKPDEAYTFGLVYSILKDGDWLVPMLAHEAFMEKPPLYYASAAAMAMLASPPLALHDAARLTSGLYMALTFCFIAGAARELYGPRYGALAVIALISCFGLVVRGHQLVTDIALLTGFSAGFYGLALALRRPVPGGIWLGTGVGIGFLAKGLLAPGMFGITALLLPLFPAWRTRNYLACLLAAAVACLPWLLAWPIALYERAPALFNEWLWTNNFGRFLGTNTLGPSADSAHYLRLLPWYTLPALPLAAWVLWRSGWRNWTAPQAALPLTGFLVIFVVLSVSADARELYALPLLLPLALLATPAVDTLRRGAANLIYWFSVMGGGFFVIVAWFYWVALELAIPLKLHQHLHTLQPGYAPGFKWLPFALGAIYTLAWIAVLLTLPKNRERPVIAWAATVTMIWGLLAILFVGWLDAGKSYRSMIADMQKAMPTGYQCMASYNLGEPQRAMLHYFAGIVTFRSGVPGRERECDLFLVHGDSNVERAPPGAWKKIWEGNRPGDNIERFRLYRRIPH
jgi:4-amino-4-deoxy-L-arabinose transferase-like glycosyltransferase